MEFTNAAARHRCPLAFSALQAPSAEKIAVLELRAPFPGATVLRNRIGPLVPDEPLASLAYPGSELRFAGGRFVEYGDDARFAGMALLEMFDGNDRLVLDHGASGAPILDCEGRVVAVVSTLITQTISFASEPGARLDRLADAQRGFHTHRCAEGLLLAE